MTDRLERLRFALSQSLGFVPGLIVAALVGVALGLTELDSRVNLDEEGWVFAGDQDAARNVLSVIAGSLITVAGLTFSITMVVLQLTSSQFSPRILRTFFADRVTRITIGAFVGTFAYALIVLREVGGFGDTGSVPRLSVAFASLLAIAAVVLLVVYLHHVSKMIQVSHVVGDIAAASLAKLGELHPEEIGTPEDEGDGGRPEAWRAEEPFRVATDRAGFVQRVRLDGVAERLREAGIERVAVLVRPGDFAGRGDDVLEAWPRSPAQACEATLKRVVALDDERDLGQDLGFGFRQLTDVAIRALSPSVNDPTTAVTCIGYLRTLLVHLARRGGPPQVRSLCGGALEAVLPARGFAEYLDATTQIGRYVDADAWVGRELLLALGACARAAEEAGRPERARLAVERAASIAEALRPAMATEADRRTIDEALPALASAA